LDIVRLGRWWHVSGVGSVCGVVGERRDIFFPVSFNRVTRESSSSWSQCHNCKNVKTVKGIDTYIILCTLYLTENKITWYIMMKKKASPGNLVLYSVLQNVVQYCESNIIITQIYNVLGTRYRTTNHASTFVHWTNALLVCSLSYAIIRHALVVESSDLFLDWCLPIWRSCHPYATIRRATNRYRISSSKSLALSTKSPFDQRGPFRRVWIKSIQYSHVSFSNV